MLCVVKVRECWKFSPLKHRRRPIPGDIGAACDLPACFMEGFETADLRAAKRLLDEMASSNAA
jgi:hypothetical protein